MTTIIDDIERQHVEADGEDAQLQAEESQEEGPTSAASQAFKQRLEAFKHVSNVPDSTEPTSIRRTTRKRTLEKEQEEPTLSPQKKKRKQTSGYAPPSKYAHLSELTDILSPNLICIFVGFNPGIKTATAGHAYAHPSNLFWKLLHSSGCTDERLHPSQDVELPRLYSMGNTNIVSRPSKSIGELSKAEMAAGTPVLEEKVRKFRPEAVCIVGKGIWEAVWRWRYGREIRKEEFRYGWQEEKERMGKIEGEWEGARVFVACATSGLAAGLKPAEKEAIWKPFGEWVKGRREERKLEEERKIEDASMMSEVS